MARKKATKKEKRQGSGNPNEIASQSVINWDQLDPNEQLSIVCELFMQRKKMAEIAKEINAKYNASLKREATYPLVMKAIKKKWIQYVPPTEDQLERELKNKHNWLSGLRVVHTSEFSQVAYHGAEMLMDLLKNFRDPRKEEIHIGFAGGHAMRILAAQFSKLLESLEKPFTKKLVLHALVAGFDVYEPTTDPNTFFTLFHPDQPYGNTYEYVGLHALPLVKSEDYPDIIKRAGVVESFDEKDKIDIIVTSATCWNDEDSTFRKYMLKHSEECFNILENDNCVGDLLWLPLGERKPIKPDKTDIRAMTLLYDLDELSKFVTEDKNVLLVLGPCGMCNRTKTSVLNAILNQENPLISHLVVDSRSAKEIIKA